MTGPFQKTILATIGDDRNTLADSLLAWFTPAELAAIAAAALQALDDTEAEMIAEATLADLRRGQPGAPFEGVMDEARLWSDMASPAELRCYLWAAFHRLPMQSRQRFLARIYGEQQGAAA